MRPYRHIIWDWNGTLLDDAWLCVEVLNGLLARRRRPPITPREYAEQFDFPVIDYYRHLGFDFDTEPFDLVAREYLAEYDRRRCECRLRAGAREVIEAMAAQGLAQHVLSAYEQRRLEASVAHLGLAGRFDRLIGLGDHYAASKLKNGLRLMRELDAHEGETLLIGDTLHDYDVARAMGVACVLIPSGHHALPRLKKCGARVLDSLPEILRLAPSPCR